MSEAVSETTSAEATDPAAVEPAAETAAADADAQNVEVEAEQAPEVGAEVEAQAAEPVRPPRLAFPPRKLVMLVEPDGPVRGSVVEMARTLPHVTVSPFSSVDLGEAYMKGQRIQALLLSVGEGAEPMEFLARLRRGECPCDADIPVVVMAPTCNAQLAGQLKEYGVSRLLIEPFKLGDMAHTLEQLWEIKVEIPPQKPAPTPEPEPQAAPEGEGASGKASEAAPQAAPEGSGEAPADARPHDAGAPQVGSA